MRIACRAAFGGRGLELAKWAADRRACWKAAKGPADLECGRGSTVQGLGQVLMNATLLAADCLPRAAAWAVEASAPRNRPSLSYQGGSTVHSATERLSSRRHSQAQPKSRAGAAINTVVPINGVGNQTRSGEWGRSCLGNGCRRRQIVMPSLKPRKNVFVCPIPARWGCLNVPGDI